MKNFRNLLLAAILLFTASTQAQISVNVNLGAQPQWGPSGYNHVDYYYLPDVGAYYNVPKKQFIYLNDGKWQFSNSLPSRYSNYNLYNGYKVVMNTPKPYLQFDNHQVKYAKYKGYNGKQTSLKASSKVKSKNAVHSNSSGQVNINHNGNNGNGNNNNKGTGNGKGNSKGKH